MEKEYENAGKNIDEFSREENFYKSEESFIRGVLKAAKRVKVETGKRIVEGLVREFGNKCLDLLCDFDINFSVDSTKNKKSTSLCQQLRDVLSPLAEIKIVGIKVFKLFLEQIDDLKVEYLLENISLESKNLDHKSNEKYDGHVEIEMYNTIRTEIIRLLEENKEGESWEAANKLRDIPLEERTKIIRQKYENKGEISEITDEEAVKKYVKDEADQKKCLKILKDIKEGEMDIADRKGYCSGEYKEDKKKSNDPLLKAAKLAIEANDLPCLKAFSRGCFLRSDCSIKLNGNEYSLFGYSCKIYSDECALYLLEEGGGIRQKFDGGDRPLHQALRIGNEAIGMFLIEIGANCNVEVQNGEKLLLEATKGGCFEVAKLLIEKGADVKVKDRHGETPLHWAAYWNRYKVAQLLIERGADIEAKDVGEETPLHYAVWRNSIEAGKLLIESGANIEAKDFRDRNTPLHTAAWFNKDKFCMILIERGADIEAKNHMEQTPLITALSNGSNEAARLLIERGANVQTKDDYGKTPLHRASDYNFDVSKLLIERGADVKVKDGCGETPLHHAAEWNILKVAQLLIEKGADIEAKNEQKRTPLHFAARGRGVEVAKLLIERGANIEAKDNDGKTPLHVAASYGGVEVAKLLIEKGANTKAKNKAVFGKTPLMMARDPEMVTLLNEAMQRN